MKPIDLIVLLAEECGYTIGKQKKFSEGVHLLLPATDFWVFVNLDADIWVSKAIGSFQCNLHDPNSIDKLKEILNGIREAYKDEKPKRILSEVTEID